MRDVIDENLPTGIIANGGVLGITLGKKRPLWWWAATWRINQAAGRTPGLSWSSGSVLKESDLVREIREKPYQPRL